MTWQSGADLSLGGLKSLRETLLDRERKLERLYAETFDDPDAREMARGLGEILDDVRGQLDRISNEIGHLESDEWEEKASAGLKLIARLAARRP